MKPVGVLLIAPFLVAGIAVGGSRAQPVPASSVAFQHCLGGAPSGRLLCRSTEAATANESIEGWIQGEQQESPEFWVAVEKMLNLETIFGPLVLEAARQLVNYLAERLVGGSLPEHLGAYRDPTIFDPAGR